MSSKAHRVVVAKRSYDVQRLDGLDKAGAKQWTTLAYFRSHDALRLYLRRRKLEHLAEGLPSPHPDCAIAANRYVVQAIEAEIAGRAKAARARRGIKARKRPAGDVWSSQECPPTQPVALDTAQRADAVLRATTGRE